MAATYRSDFDSEDEFYEQQTLPYEGDTSAANDWGKGEGINDNEHAEEVLQQMEASSLAKYWENELEKVGASIAVPQKLEQLQLNRY